MTTKLDTRKLYTGLSTSSTGIRLFGRQFVQESLWYEFFLLQNWGIKSEIWVIHIYSKAWEIWYFWQKRIGSIFYRNFDQLLIWSLSTLKLVAGRQLFRLWIKAPMIEYIFIFVSSIELHWFYSLYISFVSNTLLLSLRFLILSVSSVVLVNNINCSFCMKGVVVELISTICSAYIHATMHQLKIANR